MNDRVESAIYLSVMAIALLFAALALPMDDWKARLLPLLISTIVFLLALIGLIGVKVPRGFARRMELKPKVYGSTKEASIMDYGRQGAWLLAFFLAVHMLGFLVAIFIFCLSYAKTNDASWRGSLALATLTPFLVYFFFELVLGVELYPGLLAARLSS